jgi:uncharacterized protein with PIN domain
VGWPNSSAIRLSTIFIETLKTQRAEPPMNKARKRRLALMVYSFAGGARSKCARQARLLTATLSKGIDPKARLNLGDCTAYPLATMNSPLPFKGNDFTQRDMKVCC